jgi:hypothetical protein
MNKSLQGKNDLASRLASYAASTGALLALGSVANSQVVYSGIQNLEVNMPSDYLELDMNNDLVSDFGFVIYGTGSSYTAGSGMYNIRSGWGYAVILNPRTDTYANSWMIRNTTFTNYTSTSLGSVSTYYSYIPIVDGLGSGVTVDSLQSMWSNLTYPFYPGVLGYGYYFSVTGGTSYFYGFGLGDFFGAEHYIGVRFYIGAEQHYGWIRASVGERLDPITIIDWAYESTPGDSIITGAGDIFGPEVIIESGVTNTTDKTIEVAILFNEKAYNFNMSDLVVTNGSADNLVEIIPGREYSVEITANNGGEVMVTLPEGEVIDVLGNENELTSETWTYVAPVALDLADAEGIKIYPNPVGNSLHITLNAESMVQIIDVKGQIVFKQDQLLDQTIDVSGFNPGMYVVQIRNNTNFSQHKIVIE